MSGIEVAGLAFGVLPILVEVVKSYSTVSKKLHTLRHHGKEIKSISEQLKVHNGIFLNEVRLLLRCIEAEEEVETMLDDAADQRWMSEQFNDKLRTVLRDSFDICRSIIEDTRDTIEELRDEMGMFDIVINQKTKGESIKSTFKRLGDAFKITIDKSRHDRCLASLRDRNGDLSALRSQVSAFQRHNAYGKNTCVQHKPLPMRLNSVQNASQKLHEALCNAWCCDDSAHRGHYAKLCIDTPVQVEVRLDLAISCHEPSLDGNTSSIRKPPIWLYVQSMSTSSEAFGQQAAAPLTDGSQSSLPLERLTSCAVNVLKKKASSELQQRLPCSKKAKRVHFVDAFTAPDPSPVAAKITTPTFTPELNLCQTKNICKYLQRHYHASGATAAKHCIGYLESPKMYKHLFYFRDEKRATEPGSPRTQFDNVYSIFDVMQHDADDFLSVEDQLKLAHKTAIAMLQFNDTPWLSERWRLRDLSYFGPESSLDDEALKTLHLSSQISAPGLTTVIDNAMDDVEKIEDAVSDQVRYGINNITLFFLGVALLEIAHWKPIEEKMTPRDLNNEVFAARRLASGRAPLGPQYQKIAEKCLQCNFGFGTKLANKGLQTAVYNDVVCELESMIEKLEIS